MTTDARAARRVIRRELHPARTGPAVLVVALLLIIALAVPVLSVWALFDPGLRAGLRTVEVPQAGSPAAAAVAASAAVLLVLAVLLWAAAILPGHRNRRARIGDRHALLVDDGVLADAVSERVARRIGVDPTRVSVTAGRRTMRVGVVPTSGVPVDEAAARDAADAVLRGVGFRSEIRVTVAERGAVS
ncbi:MULTISPECIES: hypothetical protein [Leucobacter]|uniref:Alkaline shock response membrane anchor protein AmaP n=1 Tax=Leucobacter iarius TaxID=333963 RepID=A0ABN2LV47_9MICO|nr:hypothetical protein [Leucobacter sp. Ag1]KKI22341.1 hypothetical protein XM48_02065 [Leucobacter sp. Ag1]